MPKRPKRPRDANLLAKSIVDIATGEVEDEEPEKDEDKGKNPHAVALGRKGGKKGGKKAAANMTAAQRKERARKAAAARWKKK